MTNSGVPQFPQPGQYRPETPQRSAGNNDSSIGKLDRAPDEIRAEITARRKAIRLEGEVTRVNKDGSVRVQTPRGDVDVKLPVDDKAPPPKVGQRVEIEVQPPPKNAPEQRPQATLRPAPQPADAPVTRASATPVRVEVGAPHSNAAPPRVETQVIRAPVTDPNAPPPPNTFPETGSLIRLAPINAEQLEQLVTSKQLIVAESVKSAVTPPPVLDILPASSQPSSQASPSQNATPITTTAQIISTPAAAEVLANSQSAGQLPSAAAAIDQDTKVQAPQRPAQGTQQVILPTLQNTLQGVITVNGDGNGNSNNQITLPILTRAQAAVAQIQNVISNPDVVLAQSTPQDTRIGQIALPQVSIAPLSAAHASEAAVLTQPEGIAQNPILSSQKATQITGTVIAKTQSDVPIIQFDIPQPLASSVSASPPPLTGAGTLTPVQQQTFILQFPSDALVLGSRIDVTPQSTITTAASSSAQGATLSQALMAMPFANVTFPQPWPAMQEIQQTLLQQTTQTAARTAQAFTASIPSPANSAQFGAAALFFVAAVRGGDLGSWLGDKASEILRSSGKGSLLSRLSGDVATGRSAPDAPSSEWRGMNIPLLWNGDIQKLALHYKHDTDNDADEQSSGNKGTRFIFDLNLDAMGKVQVDGFFRPVSSDGPRLDIVLRTEERFSSAMQAEMRRIYMDAIKPSQVGGELSFQDGNDAWVMIDAMSENALGVSA